MSPLYYPTERRHIIAYIHIDYQHGTTTVAQKLEWTFVSHNNTRSVQSLISFLRILLWLQVETLVAISDENRKTAGGVLEDPSKKKGLGHFSLGIV